MGYTLSANTLFHFTDSFDNLESILKYEFYPKYCLENWNLVVPAIEGEKASEQREIAIPMVSFCDIPLSQIRKHVRYYGSYALGLKKEWGMRNNICPVLYTYNESVLSNRLKTLFVRAFEGMDNTEKNKFTDNFLDWLNLVKYVKPYEGYLWRDDKYHEEKIKFYDEREWRFCPDIPISSIQDEHKEDTPPIILNQKNFLQSDEITSANKMLEEYKLSFEPKDIKYIIVKREDEILGMINKIIGIKQSKYTYADLQVLTTRIISMEHIADDF